MTAELVGNPDSILVDLLIQLTYLTVAKIQLSRMTLVFTCAINGDRMPFAVVLSL